MLSDTVPNATPTVNGCFETGAHVDAPPEIEGLSSSASIQQQSSIDAAIVLDVDVSSRQQTTGLVEQQVASSSASPTNGLEHKQATQSMLSSPIAGTEAIVATPQLMKTTDSIPAPSHKDPYLLSRWPADIKRRSYGYRVPSPLNRQPGQCVVYWATASPRCHDNPAFALCRWLSHHLKLPIIAFCVFAEGVLPGSDGIVCGALAWVGGGLRSTVLLQVGARVCLSLNHSRQLRLHLNCCWVHGVDSNKSYSAKVKVQRSPDFRVPHVCFCILQAGIPLYGLTASEGGTLDQILSLLQIVKPHVVISDDSPEPADIHMKLAVSAAIKHCPIFAIDSNFICPLRNLTLDSTAAESDSVAKLDLDDISGVYAADPTFAKFCKAIDAAVTSFPSGLGKDVTTFQASPALLSELAKGCFGRINCVEWDTVRRWTSLDDSGNYIGSYSHAISLFGGVVARADAASVMDLIGRYCCERGGLYHLMPHVSNGSIVSSTLLTRIEASEKRVDLKTVLRMVVVFGFQPTLFSGLSSASLAQPPFELIDLPSRISCTSTVSSFQARAGCVSDENGTRKLRPRCNMV